MPRRVTKVARHPVELRPCFGLIVINRAWPAERVVASTARHGGAVDKGGQGRDHMDPAIIPDLRRQRRFDKPRSFI